MKHKYILPKVIIKSEVPLDDNQIIRIINAVEEVEKIGDYDPCYKVARCIYHELKSIISSVEAKRPIKRYIIRLRKK